jgi:hypothetical protein
VTGAVPVRLQIRPPHWTQPAGQTADRHSARQASGGRHFENYSDSNFSTKSGKHFFKGLFGIHSSIYCGVSMHASTEIILGAQRQASLFFQKYFQTFANSIYVPV